MQCANCHASLSPEVEACPRCGMPVSHTSEETIPDATPPEAWPPVNPPNNALTSPASSYQPEAEQAPGAFRQAPTVDNAAAAPVAPTWASSNTPQAPTWPPSNAAPTPAVYAGYAGNYATPLQPQPPAARVRAVRPATLILTILVILALLAGGIGLIFYSSVLRPAQLRAQATATTSALIAQAHIEATGTAQAITNATSTAVAQATAQAQATVTAQQNVYNQATAGNPVVNDSLSGQTANGWDVHQSIDGGYCSFFGGSLHATVYTSRHYNTCAALSTNFRNFTFQVRMTINKGDAGGLLFRFDSNTIKGYILIINRSGSYTLYSVQSNSQSGGVSGGFSSAFKTGSNKTNLITVIARGSTLTLYINKQYVNTTTDSSFQAGQIGLFASDDTQNTEVSFTNAQVWKL